MDKSPKITFVVASDVHHRDGIGIEIYLGGALALEIFRDDARKSREVSLYKRDVPLIVIEESIEISSEKSHGCSLKITNQARIEVCVLVLKLGRARTFPLVCATLLSERRVDPTAHRSSYPSLPHSEWRTGDAIHHHGAVRSGEPERRADRGVRCRTVQGLYALQRRDAHRRGAGGVRGSESGGARRADCCCGRQALRRRWSVRGVQGAGRRLLHHRGHVSR
jgi:hypothetical protein